MKTNTSAVALATLLLLIALTAATVFLCVRPPAGSGVRRDDARIALAAQVAVQSGGLVTLSDRHAGDALRIAAQGADGAEQDIGWDYVQLRL